MDALRRVSTTLCGVWGGLVIALLLAWATGLDGAAVTLVAIALGLLGGAAGWWEAKRLKPFDPQDRRDAVLGWSILALVLLGGRALAELVA